MINDEMRRREAAEMARSAMIMAWHNLDVKPSHDEMLLKFARLQDHLRDPHNMSKSLRDLSTEGLLPRELILWMMATGMEADLYATVRATVDNDTPAKGDT